MLTAIYSVACLLALTIPTAWGDPEHCIMVFLTIWTYTLLCLYYFLSSAIVVVSWTSGKMGNHLLQNVITATNEGNQDPKQQLEKGVFSIAYTKDPEAGFKTGTILNDSHVSENGGNSLSKGSNESQETIESVDAERLHWSMKLSWLLSNIVYVFAILVSVVYFTALFPLIGVTSAFIHDLNMHAFNSVLIFADSLIVARPFHLLHVIYPIIYGSCYLVFSVIYWNADKEKNVLYPGVLDWNYPTKTAIVVVLLCIIVLPLIQLMHFGIYRVRLLIFRKIYGHEFIS